MQTRRHSYKNVIQVSACGININSLAREMRWSSEHDIFFLLYYYYIIVVMRSLWQHRWELGGETTYVEAASTDAA